MTDHWMKAAVLALFASTAPLAAQTSDTQTQAQTGGGAASQLDLGQPEGPQLGERYAKEQSGDWTLACIKTEAETDPCSLLQLLKDENGNTLGEISLFRLEGGGQAVAGGTIIVPLETLLTAQVSIAVDGGQGKRYNYSFCTQLGCVAQIGFTEADIEAFRRGNSARVTIVPAPAPDQQVVLNMSLSGFTAGYDMVDVVQANGGN
ncbi:MAG: invasion associated locus B family protein [Rhodobacteraceae bacterium]|nr:MAG: invasion associated locus B family protein [Paracoccaceae bacterium]